MTESPSVPVLCPLRPCLSRAWIPFVAVVLGLAGVGCSDLPVEAPASQTELDAPATVELMAEAAGLDQSESGSTLCRALMRHRDRVLVEVTAGEGGADEGMALELDAVLLELCG